MNYIVSAREKKKVEKDWIVYNPALVAVTMATFLLYRPDT